MSEPLEKKLKMSPEEIKCKLMNIFVRTPDKKDISDVTLGNDDDVVSDDGSTDNSDIDSEEENEKTHKSVHENTNVNKEIEKMEEKVCALRKSLGEEDDEFEDLMEDKIDNNEIQDGDDDHNDEGNIQDKGYGKSYVVGMGDNISVSIKKMIQDKMTERERVNKMLIESNLKEVEVSHASNEYMLEDFESVKYENLTLREEIKILKDDMKKKENTIKEMTEIKEISEEKLRNLKKKEKQIDILVKQNFKLLEDSSVKNKDLRELKMTVELHQSLTKKLKNSAEEASHENRKLMFMLSHKETELKEIKENKESLVSQLSMQKNAITAINSELGLAKQKNNILIEEKTKSEEQFNSYIKEFSNKSDAMMKKIKKLSEENIAAKLTAAAIYESKAKLEDQEFPKLEIVTHEVDLKIKAQSTPLAPKITPTQALWDPSCKKCVNLEETNSFGGSRRHSCSRKKKSPKIIASKEPPMPQVSTSLDKRFSDPTEVFKAIKVNTEDKDHTIVVLNESNVDTTFPTLSLQKTQVLLDCGDCSNCKDKPQFGGPNTKRQKCLWRKKVEKKDCGECKYCKGKKKFGGNRPRGRVCINKRNNINLSEEPSNLPTKTIPKKIKSSNLPYSPVLEPLRDQDPLDPLSLSPGLLNLDASLCLQTPPSTSSSPVLVAPLNKMVPTEQLVKPHQPYWKLEDMLLHSMITVDSHNKQTK